MDSLSEVYRRDRNCLVLDQPTYDAVYESGAIKLDPKHLHIKDELGHMRTPETGVDQMRLFSALKLSAHMDKWVFSKCLKKVQDKFGIGHDSHDFMAVHMRVEDSWMDRYCTDEDDNGGNRKLLNSIYMPGESKEARRACFGADEVARIIGNTKNLQKFANVLLLYDANHFLQEDHWRPAKYTKDPMDVWPSNMTAASPYHLGCFQAKDSFTERAVATMFLANWADAFAGPMLSSDDVTVTKFRQHGGRH
eukprot:scaffold225512_cov30-Prasinocladus_malaysianus.AAC.1